MVVEKMVSLAPPSPPVVVPLSVSKASDLGLCAVGHTDLFLPIGDEVGRCLFCRIFSIGGEGLIFPDNNFVSPLDFRSAPFPHRNQVDLRRVVVPHAAFQPHGRRPPFSKG